MSPEQCRAARAWLGWSQHDLAGKARLSSTTIIEFEAGRRIPHANNLLAIRGVLEQDGVEFPDDFTLRVSPPPQAQKLKKQSPRKQRE